MRKKSAMEDALIIWALNQQLGDDNTEFYDMCEAYIEEEDDDDDGLIGYYD